jgi:hypothetical protein
VRGERVSFSPSSSSLALAAASPAGSPKSRNPRKSRTSFTAGDSSQAAQMAAAAILEGPLGGAGQGSFKGSFQGKAEEASERETSEKEDMSEKEILEHIDDSPDDSSPDSDSDGGPRARGETHAEAAGGDRLMPLQPLDTGLQADSLPMRSPLNLKGPGSTPAALPAQELSPAAPSRSRSRNTIQRSLILAALKTGSFRTVRVKSRRASMSAFEPLIVEGASGVGDGAAGQGAAKPGKPGRVDPMSSKKGLESGGDVVEGLAAKDVGKWRLPGSTFRVYWECMNFILYISNAFLIPSRIIVTSRGTEESTSITYAALLIQLNFLIDMVLRSAFFAYEEQGVVVADTGMILSR